MKRDLQAFVREVLGQADLPGHGMQRVDHAEHLLALLRATLAAGVPGDVVELGCNAGLTAVVLQAALQQDAPSRRLHVYDSFAGLPPRSRQDGAADGDAPTCSATQGQLQQNFARFGLPLPEIHAGWFADTLPAGLPPAVAFAHLDADLHDSTLEGLRQVWPRLARGGVIVLHDYIDPACRQGVPDWVRIEDHIQYPGVKAACDGFFGGRPEAVQLLYSEGRQSGQGFVRRT
jgi:O-methyltransferase